MNSVTMIGRLTREPELRRTQSGTACCSFSLAVKRPRTKDITDFHDFVAWQQGAEYLCQYGHKGDLVGVIGHLTTRDWKDRDGNNRKAIEVTVDSLELLSSKRESNPAQAQNTSHGQPSYAQQNFDVITDPDVKLPF